MEGMTIGDFLTFARHPDPIRLIYDFRCSMPDGYLR